MASEGKRVIDIGRFRIMRIANGSKQKGLRSSIQIGLKLTNNMYNSGARL